MKKEIKNLAVINLNSTGGISRFDGSLVIALKRRFPELKISYFSSRELVKKESFDSLFSPQDIKICFLDEDNIEQNEEDLKESNSLTKVSFVYRLSLKVERFLSFLIIEFIHPLKRLIPSLRKELEDTIKEDTIKEKIEKKINSEEFDIALFTFPLSLECPKLSCPMVGVFHDFNQKYFFGAPIFTEERIKEIEDGLLDWINIATPVVSTKFMKAEIEKFYPSLTNKTTVIHLAAFSALTNMSKEKAHEIINQLAIEPPYIICPNNACIHKDTGTVIKAHYLYNKANPDKKIKLILTGGRIPEGRWRSSYFGAQRVNSESEADILTLGYVSRDQIDALIQSAEAVINASLYEAGSGSGLDAWQKGVPVILSDIPPFLEHLEVLKVYANIFESKNAKDLSNKISDVLNNKEKYLILAKESQLKLSEYSWDIVAEKYMSVFEEALNK